VFIAPPSKTAIQPGTVVLADEARKGDLVVCVGAGISFEARLPSGPKLGRLLNDIYEGEVEGYVAPDDPANLLKVADAAAALEGGDDALRRQVLGLAPFEEAVPAYAHRAIALLLTEGAFTVLSWNWDTCIERATPVPEGLQVARQEVDMQRLSAPQLVKVHGCAQMPSSLLVTSSHLELPPNWTSETFIDRLGKSTMVFVGIGDVADYAARRIDELLEKLDDGQVSVVSPTIRSEWAENQWSLTMPNLPEERRIGLTADAFFDELARGWLKPLRATVRTSSTSLTEPQQEGVSKAMNAFGEMDAVAALTWLRKATMYPKSGESVARASAPAETLIAIGELARAAAAEPVFIGPSSCQIGTDRVEVLMTRGLPPSTEVKTELMRRAVEVASAGQARSGEVTFVVAGNCVGDLAFHDAEFSDIVGGTSEHDDVVDGPLAVRPLVLLTRDLVKDAA
jgi:hypothetical protein